VHGELHVEAMHAEALREDIHNLRCAAPIDLVINSNPLPEETEMI